MPDAPHMTAPDPAASDPQLQHLAHLHRMSRTAGLGSSDYSAVNIAAVVAVLIGAASALALITPIFLFLPLIGVIVSAIAVMQIRSSNGTQTGLALAVLGLVLSVGLSAVTGLQAYRGYVQARNDVAGIDAVTTQFGQYIAQGKYDEAYQLTDNRFRDQVPLATFRSTFDRFASFPSLGKINGMNTRKLFSIETDTETQRRMAVGYAYMDTQQRSGNDAVPLEMRYRTDGDSWKIFAFPSQMFGSEKAAGASGGGGGAAAGTVGPPAPR